MLQQRLIQKLQQKLSPQQIQVLKLLMVPTAQLEQRIKEELEINPALEEGSDEESEFENLEETATTDETREEDTGEGETETEENEENLIDDEIDLADYYNEGDEEIADYKLRDSNEVADPDDENKTIPISVNSSFHESLIAQLGLLELNEKELLIAHHVIGSLDNDGYLRRTTDAIVDDMVFSHNLIVEADEVQKVITIIQGFDPPGVGARTLAECLLIQLRRNEETEVVKISIKILEKYFDAFVKKHYSKLENTLGISSEMLKAAIDEIVRLNPKPGSAFAGGENNSQYITPDFYISNSNGELMLSLNSQNTPELRVSSSFKEMVNDYNKSKLKSKSKKEALLFIKQKIDAAKWFIDAIKQRQHTLLLTMNAIMELQQNYLLTGDETNIKPLILKDVAERVGLDVSTISRVASSKYVQTEFGILPLKFFFSEAMQTDSGEEVSTREIKKILQEIIEAEDKSNPVSDIDLTEALEKKGYMIARRTVAKYREQLNIPVARLRKEL
jgi:RNA polymerase sigma-54 factor